MTDTLMWEAKAAPGRGTELLRWVLDEALPAFGPQVRTEVFTAADRVVLIAVGGRERRLPEPPPELTARPPHAWPFRRVATRAVE